MNEVQEEGGEMVVSLPRSCVNVRNAKPFMVHSFKNATKMDEFESPEGLPPGWKRRCVMRKNGATAGQFDVYYYSPDGKRFRSRKEIERFLEKVASPLHIKSFDFRRAELNRDPTRRRERSGYFLSQKAELSNKTRLFNLESLTREPSKSVIVTVNGRDSSFPFESVPLDTNASNNVAVSYPPEKSPVPKSQIGSKTLLGNIVNKLWEKKMCDGKNSSPRNSDPLSLLSTITNEEDSDDSDKPIEDSFNLKPKSTSVVQVSDPPTVVSWSPHAVGSLDHRAGVARQVGGHSNRNGTNVFYRPSVQPLTSPPPYVKMSPLSPSHAPTTNTALLQNLRLLASSWQQTPTTASVSNSGSSNLFFPMSGNGFVPVATAGSVSSGSGAVSMASVIPAPQPVRMSTSGAMYHPTSTHPNQPQNFVSPVLGLRPGGPFLFPVYPSANQMKPVVISPPGTPVTMAAFMQPPTYYVTNPAVQHVHMKTVLSPVLLSPKQ